MTFDTEIMDGPDKPGHDVIWVERGLVLAAHPSLAMVNTAAIY
jgi:hypothetical protein